MPEIDARLDVLNVCWIFPRNETNALMKMDFGLIDVTLRFSLFCIAITSGCVVRSCNKLGSCL
ncbi:hypothetical protein QR46_2937 [Giardia duodenalis assemblage B]|uniref:Uncharacterized protein n=1 Tax=Giardia duodenalis assemblage B TaxID=1394984 RepID=A0A132NSQ0_GIAIN|nr:hypothetical protein QR46_2937 [Giardia intestinalis assemblage B]